MFVKIVFDKYEKLWAGKPSQAQASAEGYKSLNHLQWASVHGKNEALQLGLDRFCVFGLDSPKFHIC